MSTVSRPVVFGDVLPIANARVRTAVLVVGFALLTAAAAQVKISLGFTPVPVTLQTASVILAGAVLGSRLGAMSIGLYVIAGLFLPFYAGGEQGWTYATGATGGYLLGMIIASYVVGLLAERSEDRRVLTALPAMFFGTVIIYMIGAPWLASVLNISIADAVAKGVAPFIIGDVLKSFAIGLIVPAAWKLSKK